MAKSIENYYYFCFKYLCGGIENLKFVKIYGIFFKCFECEFLLVFIFLEFVFSFLVRVVVCFVDGFVFYWKEGVLGGLTMGFCG